MPPMGFRVPHGIAKTIAIVVGLALTILALMALIGLLTDNFWIRLVPAVLVAVATPLIAIERMLPADEPKRAKGLPTDFLAILWLGFAVLFVGVAGPITRGVLVAEGDRYAASGPMIVARSVYWIAGATPEMPEPPQDSDEAEGAEGPDAGTAQDGAVTDRGVEPTEPAADAGAVADGGGTSGDGAAPTPAATGEVGVAQDAAASPSDTDR